MMRLGDNWSDVGIKTRDYSVTSDNSMGEGDLCHGEEHPQMRASFEHVQNQPNKKQHYHRKFFASVH